jgi:hypothetical protein
LNFVNRLDSDPRWFPSYVPRTYQFRRTILKSLYAYPVPRGSAVLAEVALMPGEAISQKFSSNAMVNFRRGNRRKRRPG